MWDSNALSQLLKSMPNKLSKDNLEKIQLVIDADKYKNSLLSGFDLCDMYMYAPFCKGCKKTSIYPCAIAYINMMKAQGADVEIGAKPVTGGAGAAYVSSPVVEEPVAFEEAEVFKEQEQVQEQAVEEIAVTSQIEETSEEQSAEVKPAELPVEEVNEEIKEQPLEEQTEEPRAIVEPPETAVAVPSEPAVKRKIRIAVARKKI